jgi:hypothetical protein
MSSFTATATFAVHGTVVRLAAGRGMPLPALRLDVWYVEGDACNEPLTWPCRDVRIAWYGMDGWICSYWGQGVHLQHYRKSARIFVSFLSFCSSVTTFFHLTNGEGLDD